MRSFLGLLLVVGLASALNPEVKKLTIFGVPGVSGVSGSPFLPPYFYDPVTSPFSGFRNVFPFSSISPFSNFLNPFIYPSNVFSSGLLRSPVSPVTPVSPASSVSPNLYDIYNKPVMVAVKGKPEVDGLSIYLLEDGISSLSVNPSTKFIHEMIKSGTEKNAVVIYPESMAFYPVYKSILDLPVMHMEIPQNMKLGRFVRGMLSHIPLVMIYGKEDIHQFDVEGLIRLGNFGITEDKVVCETCF